MKSTVFAGSISLAGMEGPLYRVKFGNSQIPRALCQSMTQKVESSVTQIRLLDSSKFAVTVKNEEVYSDFDYVILAAPLDRDDDSKKIDFRGFPEYFQTSIWEGSYRRTVATIVAGELNNSVFHTESKMDHVIDLNVKASVASVAKIADVSGNSDSSSVWKIFSNIPLKLEELNRLFPQNSGSRTIDWKAYPDYNRPPKQSPPFVLYNRMFYLNAVEWIGSAMEMSLVAAQNIAIAVDKEITGGAGNLFCPNKPCNSKKEL